MIYVDSACSARPLFVTTTSAMSYTAPTLSAGATYYWKVVANGSVSSPTWSFTTQTVVPAGLQFYPVTPCRVADTRSYGGMTGPSGPPSMTASSTRSFPVSGSCGIPANAVAYSLNVTAVPQTGYLGWLTTWPTGKPMPVASTLNSWNGVIVANAAIVPAGTGGALSVFVSDPADVFVDVNGYFAPPASDGLQFYPITPCRVADTRSYGGKTGASGPPSMARGTSRTFPVVAASCGIPSTAVAYALNMTAVPQTNYFGWLTTWPTGKPMPVASTLNSWDGTIVANTTIVPAGTGGSISIFASDPADVFFDINGYFAPPTVSGLDFYPVNPCRIADTRAFVADGRAVWSALDGGWRSTRFSGVVERLWHTVFGVSLRAEYDSGAHHAVFGVVNDVADRAVEAGGFDTEFLERRHSCECRTGAGRSRRLGQRLRFRSVRGLLRYQRIL